MKRVGEFDFLPLTTAWVFDHETGECLGMLRNLGRREWLTATWDSEGTLRDTGQWHSRPQALRHLQDRGWEPDEIR